MGSRNNLSHKRILHVGWGFIPWRGGGLIEYAHDLMNHQTQLGWQVDYFFAGRKYPFGQKAYLKKWFLKDVCCHEIINSPIVPSLDLGTSQPLMQLDEPVSEELFRETLEATEPDLIHFHEFSGLPSSLIKIAKNEFEIPTLMTLADYYLLCPTLKLFDVNKENCRLQEVSQECVNCCHNPPRNHRRQIVQTLLYPYKNMRVMRCIPRRHAASVLSLIKGACDAGTRDSSEVSQTGNEFNLRRKTNLERLKMVDQLVARSRRVEEIYKYYLRDNAQITIINPHLLHIDNITMESIAEKPKTIQFVTLNGLASIQKGGRLILDAVGKLNEAGYFDQYVLHVWGALGQDFVSEMVRIANIRYHGEYEPDKLDQLLSGKHVGILPSVWEEVYGYVGPEMLAKGLPLIANKIGGITEYAVDGENAILNHSCSSHELARHMEKVILNPDVIIQLNQKMLKVGKVRTYEQHFAQLNAVYDQMVGA